ncbi:Extracellular metalloproteinase [Abortiporus biennis]
MRRLLVASLVAAGLASTFAHPASSDNTLIRRRKTLGFGPENPNSVYRLGPLASTDFSDSSYDPYLVARQFIEQTTFGDVPTDSTFQIRKDSYTDKNTRITHIYARQYINGVEVADGDFNVNVRDGIIISYGDSFYRGLDASLDFAPNAVGTADVHAEFCNQLAEEMESRVQSLQQQSVSSGEQVIMGNAVQDLGDLPTIYEWNCAHVQTPYAMAEGKSFTETESDYSKEALLQFMIAATPDNHLSQDMIDRSGDYLNKMKVSFEHNVAGSHAMPSFTIDNVPDAVNPVKANMVFVQVPNGDATSLELVWKYEVEMKDNWYEAAVTAYPPHRIVSVVDWASDSPLPVAPVPKKPASEATYNVFKWGINDPSEGNRTVEKENFDSLASPAGWHSLPYTNDPQSEFTERKKGGKTAFRNTTTTWGNNVFAHENWDGRNAFINNYRPDAASKEFHFPYDPKKTDSSSDAMDEARKHINATVTQLFYTGNMIHDIYYRYGFDEVSGNFQQHNFGRGGEENDGVIMNAQDGSGFNNANFMTPPDGQNGRCRMYLWNTANPYRDGDLEAGIVIHEYSHGLSTRLTGGPANSGCLGWGESGGMGEGWGDFLATTIRSNANYSDYPMGAWAANRDNGIRNYPYSLNTTINPSTYQTLDKPGYWGVHAIGEVWAQMLWVVSQRLIEKYGFSDSIYPPLPNEKGEVPVGDFYRPQEYTADGEKKPLIPIHGNTLIFQLVINGMKLQPCRPSFFQARDAIIAADKALTGGENFCELWKGFAASGLGLHAKVIGRNPWGGGVRTDDATVPKECLTTTPKPDPEDPLPGDDDDDEDWEDYWTGDYE